MDCKQIREVLDCYVDGELSPESMASADAHVRGCRSCIRAVEHLNALRSQVRRVVAAHAPPSDLQQRMRHSLRAGSGIGRFRMVVRSRFGLAATVVVLIGASVLIASATSFRASFASGIDRLTLRIDDVRDVHLDGTVLCRDCELERRHGIRVLCPTIGHHGALATDDGRIWSIVEQPGSSNLIHNSDLLGMKVHTHGRIFRSASSVSIRRYEVLGPTAERSAQLTHVLSMIIP